MNPSFIFPFIFNFIYPFSSAVVTVPLSVTSGVYPNVIPEISKLLTSLNELGIFIEVPSPPLSTNSTERSSTPLELKKVSFKVKSPCCVFVVFSSSKIYSHNFR